MFKKTLIILPILALTAAFAAPAGANECPAPEVKKMEINLEHLKKQAAHAKKDPNKQRRDHEMKRLDEIAKQFEGRLKACQEKRRQECAPQRVKKMENDLHHLSQSWFHIMMTPDEGRRRHELGQLNAQAEHVAKMLEPCRR